MQPLIISSTVQLKQLHSVLETLNETSPGYQSELIYGSTETKTFPDFNSYVKIDRGKFVMLLNILRVLQCHKLSLQNTFGSGQEETHGPIKTAVLPNLREISMVKCGESAELIGNLITKCPQLESLTQVDPDVTEMSVKADYRQISQSKDLTFKIDRSAMLNYRLTRLESTALQHELQILGASELRPEDRKYFKEYSRTMNTALTRNRKGYQRCRGVIYQLFLIKRYRPESVFRFINRDVVMLIAKLIHATIGTELWCQ